MLILKSILIIVVVVVIAALAAGTAVGGCRAAPAGRTDRAGHVIPAAAAGAARPAAG